MVDVICEHHHTHECVFLHLFPGLCIIIFMFVFWTSCSFCLGRYPMHLRFCPVAGASFSVSGYVLRCSYCSLCLCWAWIYLCLFLFSTHAFILSVGVLYGVECLSLAESSKLSLSSWENVIEKTRERLHIRLAGVSNNKVWVALIAIDSCLDSRSTHWQARLAGRLLTLIKVLCGSILCRILAVSGGWIYGHFSVGQGGILPLL